MNRRWLYPYYVIALLLLVMWLTGCNRPHLTSQGNPFAKTERLTTTSQIAVEAGAVFSERDSKATVLALYLSP